MGFRGSRVQSPPSRDFAPASRRGLVVPAGFFPPPLTCGSGHYRSNPAVPISPPPYGGGLSFLRRRCRTAFPSAGRRHTICGARANSDPWSYHRRSVQQRQEISMLKYQALQALATLGMAVLPSTSAAQPAQAPKEGLRIIAFGAHPDDCELDAGGVAAKWVALGHKFKCVSVTNGDIGHATIAGGPLALRRHVEALAAARILGIETEVLDNHDGELMVTLENRRQIARLIREWQADVVISHRPNDYHPDHRYTGVLVMDAAYMVQVPFFGPEVPPLRRNPVFLFSEDRFQKPSPFSGDIVVAIDDVIEKKLAVVEAMESQFYEGGCCDVPAGGLPQDAAGKAARKKEIRDAFSQRFASTADRFRARLAARYGQQRASAVKYAEAFEICEYGRQPDEAEIRRLFPFFP